jgi:hypothetical protein
MEASETFINGEPIAEEEENPILAAADEQLDDLEIQVEAREWVVVGPITVTDPRTNALTELDFERTYTQKPLSYTAMLQFTGLIGDRISTVMNQGVTLESVLGDVGIIAGAFGGEGGITREDFAGVDSFVRGLAKLASYIPDIVEECQCIWLRVPLHERQVVKDIWGRSPVDGGQSMQDGEDMLNLFIAQNYQELEDFFVERLPRVLRQAQRARTTRKLLGGAGRRLSKPLSSIADPTLKE